MLLVSDRTVKHAGVMYDPGEEFEETNPQYVEQLLTRPGIRRADPPKIIYEYQNQKTETEATKNEELRNESDTAGDSEVVAPPFRHLFVSDAEPSPLATAGDPVLPSANLPEPGIADTRRRRGRPRRNPAA